VSGTSSGTARRATAPHHPTATRPDTDPDVRLSRRFAYGFSALVGFVLGVALYSVARHRSLAGAMLLLITVLGGLLLVIANEDAVAQRGFKTDAIDRTVATGTFSVLLFTGVLCNALLFD